MKTFDILQEFRALESLLNEINEESGEFINSEDDIKEYIENLSSDRNTKLDNIERLKREIEGQSKTIDEEVKRLQAYKKQKTNNIEQLKNLQFLLTNGEKIETDLYKFSSRKSKSVSILDEDKVKERGAYIRTKIEIDKTAIKKAIESGETVQGAEIIEKISLSVK